MKQLVLIMCLVSISMHALASREFTVMTYNVENLFDLDGVALYSDYEQAPKGHYGPDQLLGKLEGIYLSLSAINDGAGPEVVLFQELELDRTPFDTPDKETFLRTTAGSTLDELLNGKKSVGISVANLPSELLLLKYLEERGMTGYQIAQPDSFVSESHPAHKNVIFTRFPIKYVRQRALLDARDVLIVGLDIDGNELVLLNNHWKSGASSSSLETIRVQNARVVRAEVDAILYRNPQADVIVAGDLNSYYNHAAVFPEIPETGVNDVLRSDGREVRMIGEKATKDLYNLWYELPAEERGSEVWRGKWGTLMQMTISQGLYDNKGIQYIDNSFDRLTIPGKNVDSRWGRPISWTNFGGGSGFSDHLPIYARFQVADGDKQPEFDKPSDEPTTEYRPDVNLKRMDRRAVPSLERLTGLDDVELAEHLGELFLLKLPLSANKPARIKIGDRELMIYSPITEIRNELNSRNTGELVHAFVELDTYRSSLQVVILDESWLKN